MQDKKTSPCFPMYPSDFFGDPNVRLMDGHEQAFYAILLMNMWQNAKGKEMPFLPNDDQKLAKLLKISVKDWKKVKNSIFDCLKVSDDKIESPRLSREKAKQDKYRELQAEKGRKGGRPQKPEESPGFSAVKPEESNGIFPVKLPNPNPNPNPNNLIRANDIVGKETDVLKPALSEKEKKDLLEIRPIYEKAVRLYPGFNAQLFFQNHIRDNIEAVKHTLNRLIEESEAGHPVEKPMLWCEAVMRKENMNYNAADEEKKNQEFKNDKNPMAALSSLVNGMLKSVPGVVG